jgi:hypothetical protein
MIADRATGMEYTYDDEAPTGMILLASTHGPADGIYNFKAKLGAEWAMRDCIVFVIYYFGFAQPAIDRIAEECLRRQFVLIEDCAHPLF